MNERIRELAKDADIDWHRYWNDDGSNRLQNKPGHRGQGGNVNHDELIERLEEAEVREPQRPSGQYITTLGEQAAADIRSLLAERDEMQQHIDALQARVQMRNRTAEPDYTKEMYRLLVWGSALMRSMSGWPEHHPNEFSDWKEDWRKLREKINVR